jgi:hypothetical protein
MEEGGQGGLWERMYVWGEMRSNGAWESRWSLPTREDYRQFLVVNTEGHVMAEDIHEDWTALRAAVEAHQQLIQARDTAVEAHQREMEMTHGEMLADFNEDMAHIRGHLIRSMETIIEGIQAQVDAVDPVYQAAEQAYRREQERIGEAIARLSDPDSLGEQAEERFYNEQDPDSEWYRADLYGGLPGPDVQAEWDALEDAFDEEQRRIAAGEPRYASPEAEQAAIREAWELSDEGIAAEARMLERYEQAFPEDRPYAAREDDPPFGPDEGIIVDTSHSESAEDLQALLARLDQRLEALVQATERDAQVLTPKQGVRY